MVVEKMLVESRFETRLKIMVSQIDPAPDCNLLIEAQKYSFLSDPPRKQSMIERGGGASELMGTERRTREPIHMALSFRNGGNFY